MVGHIYHTVDIPSSSCFPAIFIFTSIIAGTSIYLISCIKKKEKRGQNKNYFSRNLWLYFQRYKTFAILSYSVPSRTPCIKTVILFPHSYFSKVFEAREPVSREREAVVHRLKGVKIAKAKRQLQAISCSAERNTKFRRSYVGARRAINSEHSPRE